MFNKLRDKTGKQFVEKYLQGKPIRMGQAGEREVGADGVVYECLGGSTWVLKTFGNIETPLVMEPSLTNLSIPEEAFQHHLLQLMQQQELNLRQQERAELRTERQLRRAETKEAWENANDGKALGTVSSAVLNGLQKNWGTMAADIGLVAMKGIDQVAMGDNNFGAQSEAIDGAVHATSSALLQSGNPYAMAAGAALEGANFLTKAGGQTVQGFDVDINSSGYGDLGHMESSSSRDFGAMIGLGGLNQGKIQAKLAKRNQQAMMAMNAANIANEQSFEQEARMNSVQNTITNNQIALAGGLDTSLLGN